MESYNASKPLFLTYTGFSFLFNAYVPRWILDRKSDKTSITTLVDQSFYYQHSISMVIYLLMWYSLT